MAPSIQLSLMNCLKISVQYLRRADKSAWLTVLCLPTRYPFSGKVQLEKVHTNIHSKNLLEAGQLETVPPKLSCLNAESDGLRLFDLQVMKLNFAPQTSSNTLTGSPYVFAMLRLYNETFAACTCTVPLASFEPAEEAGRSFVNVTANWESAITRGQITCIFTVSTI